VESLTEAWKTRANSMAALKREFIKRLLATLPAKTTTAIRAARTGKDARMAQWSKRASYTVANVGKPRISLTSTQIFQAKADIYVQMDVLAVTDPGSNISTMVGWHRTKNRAKPMVPEIFVTNAGRQRKHGTRR
jgi:hypothetical protein